MDRGRAEAREQRRHSEDLVGFERRLERGSWGSRRRLVGRWGGIWGAMKVLGLRQEYGVIWSLARSHVT